MERKRLRGELSCAECRRLKLRCDRKLPCSSCERRGCKTICPLGNLAAGQGTRYVLADTEHLHVKIYEMSNRIRQLEDALAFLQSAVSDETHPLLTEDMLRVKFGSEVFNGPRISTSVLDLAGVVASTNAVTEESIDALGTLTLGSSGDVHYFGRSAGSEALMLRAGDDAEDIQDQSHTTTELQPCVQDLPFLFPFSSKSRLDLHAVELLEKSLPSQGRASQLCKHYLSHAAYFFRPIKDDELLGELLPSVYKANERSSTNDVDVSYAQSLAMLFFIFGLGALLDLTLTPYNAEAEKYYELGRAALSLSPVYNTPNLESVRAVGLMATYHSFAGKKYTRDSAWSLMSIAAKVAQSIGLHRDSSKWNMDPKLVQRRRNLFWEVFSADLSHSLALGRPPAIHPSYVDCEFPIDDDAALGGAHMEHEVGLWRMKHIFARDVYNSVAEITLIAKPPSYAAILDLDKKVKSMSCPTAFNPFASVEELGEGMFHSSSLALRDFYASQNSTVTMLYLHRSFFAQALLDHPDNPLLGPFAPSFLAACRSASIIIKAAETLFRRCAPIATRVWFLMYHMLSAAVILGIVVTRSPTSNSASTAMRDFNVAFDVFNEAAGHSQRAKIALGILQKLRDKARHAFETVQNDISPRNSYSSDTPGQDDDIVAIFGGQKSVLDRRVKQKAPPSSFPLPSSYSPSSNKTPAPSFAHTSGLANVETDPGTDGALPDVHPSLIEYLNQEAVRRALQQERHDTASDQSSFGLLSSHHAQTISVGHQPQEVTVPGASEPRPLSYLIQTSSAIGAHPQSGSYGPFQLDDGIQGSPAGSELVPSLRADKSTIMSQSFDDSEDPSLLSSAFNIPNLVGTGSSNRAFANVDWFSFMRDCGIMDIEDD